MKTYPECFGCILRQAVSVVTFNVDDQDIQIQTLRKVLNHWSWRMTNSVPSEIAGETQSVMRDTLGITDLP